VEVGRLTEELSALRNAPDNANDLRRVLYGLYTLVKVHFAKEEEVYLPLLDARLSEQEAQAMFARMEDAAHQAKNALTG
jgi:hemerythrin-like domain-containing protein